MNGVFCGAPNMSQDPLGLMLYDPDFAQCWVITNYMQHVTIIVLSRLEYACSTSQSRIYLAHREFKTCLLVLLQAPNLGPASALLLKHIHWLPVSARIHFKIALLTFKSVADLQVYWHATQHEAAVLAERMSACIENVKAWMSSNRLRLNPSKTELIWLGSSRRLHDCSSTGMRVSGVDPQPVDCVPVAVPDLHSNQGVAKSKNN